MRRGVVNGVPQGNDAKGVNRWMTAIVMLLDVVHVHCWRHSGDLVHILEVVEHVGVFTNKLLVALEMNNIHLQYHKITDSNLQGCSVLQADMPR